MGSFIPRNLDEIDPEMIEDEINKIFSKKDIYYDKLSGLVGDKSKEEEDSDSELSEISKGEE